MHKRLEASEALLLQRPNRCDFLEIAVAMKESHIMIER